MRNMLYIIWGSLCLLLVISGCKSTDGAKAPVSLTWKMGAVEVQPGYYENSFVLKNISDVPLGKDWIIYYSQLPREILQEESAPVKVEVVNANFFRMYPAENFQPLAPGDSLTVKFCCTNGLKKMSHAPEGTYWVSQSGSKQGIPLPVGLTIQPLKGMETEDWYPAPDKIYASNLALETTAQLQQTDIFPSVKEAVPATGKEGFAIENKVKLTFHPDFANEAELLKEKLATIHGLEVVSEAPVTVHLDYLPERETAVNGEYYRIDTGNGLINISASTSHGIFNGTQTLLSLLKGQEKPFRLEALSCATFSVMAKAPTGIPFPIPFAIVRISGFTPNFCHANIAPVLPIPHCTSSQIIRISFSSQILRIPSMNSCVARLIPPSPCNGSKIIAQV